jgi:Kelch motif protein
VKHLYDGTRRQQITRQITMWGIYGSIVVLALIGGYFLGRSVINQPWTARTHMGSVVIDDLLFVVGGQAQSTGELLDDVWEINLSTNSLRAVAQLPYGCYRPETATSNGQLFVLGGYDGQSYRSEILRIIDDAAEIAAMLPSPRAYGAAIGVKDVLYYAGGWDGERMLDEMLAINVISGEVTVIGHLSSPRRFVAAAKVGDLIYFIGGEEARSKLSDEIVEFDPSTHRTLRTGHMSSGRYLVNAIAHDSGLLVLGGKSTRSLDDVLFVNLSDDTISSELVDAVSELSWNLGVEAVGDRVFILGGVPSDVKRAIGVTEYVPGGIPSLIPIQLRKNPWQW